jgi:hypothetical protein
MRRRTLAIARAEWIHNRRDVRSLIVIIALPAVLLLLYGYGINYDLDHIPFAVYDLDGTEVSRELIDQFRRSRYFSLREAIQDQGRIDALLDRGEVAFVLVTPPDLGRTIRRGREAKVQVIVDGADTTRANVAIGYIEAAIMEYSGKLGADFRARQGLPQGQPFTVHATILYNPGLESVRFIVPGLIALLLTLLAALLTSTCIVREREWGSFESLVTSPARASEILIGKMIPYVVIAFADIVLCVVSEWQPCVPACDRRAVSGRVVSHRRVLLGSRADAATGDSACDAHHATADGLAVGLRVSIAEYAGCAAGGLERDSGYALPGHHPLDIPEGRRAVSAVAAGSDLAWLHGGAGGAGGEEVPEATVRVPEGSA